MAIIYTSRNFIVQSAEFPLIDRKDGGHITIDPKKPIVDRQQLYPAQAIELMRLTIVVGEVMTRIMNEHNVDIGRLNYQDNGNWSVFKPEGAFLHVHIYGRAKSAARQPYGQTLHFPHKDDHPELYRNLEVLSEADVQAMTRGIEELFETEKYADSQWHL